MGHEDPYLVARCDVSDRYIVKRTCDGSIAGYVLQVNAGWEIEDEAGRRGVTRYAAEATKHRVFATLDEAALFVYTRNRAYQKFINIEVPPERIEIRVTPNFGQCIVCTDGQWVAYLYQEDGTPAGLCCSDSLEEVKFKGLLKAHFKTYPEPTEEMRRTSKEDWTEALL
jgi:hypothetical protein